MHAVTFRTTRRALAVLIAAGIASTAPRASANTTLRMATLAPKQSPWGKVFRAWSEATLRDTHGSVDLTWQWNGVAGPERS